MRRTIALLLKGWLREVRVGKILARRRKSEIVRFPAVCEAARRDDIIVAYHDL